jgi:hypothetical protein
MKAEDVLPDDVNLRDFGGLQVRKGTVAAFLANARTWLADTTSPEARAEAERDLIATLPGVHALGLFDVLDVRDPRLRQLIARHPA